MPVHSKTIDRNVEHYLADAEAFIRTGFHDWFSVATFSHHARFSVPRAVDPGMARSILEALRARGVLQHQPDADQYRLTRPD